MERNRAAYLGGVLVLGFLLGLFVGYPRAGNDRDDEYDSYTAEYIRYAERESQVFADRYRDAEESLRRAGEANQRSIEYQRRLEGIIGDLAAGNASGAELIGGIEGVVRESLRLLESSVIVSDESN